MGKTDWRQNLTVPHTPTPRISENANLPQLIVGNGKKIKLAKFDSRFRFFTKLSL